jgi:hypothetical protein
MPGPATYLVKKNANYEGEWRNEMPEGRGRLVFAKGAVLEGVFRDGDPNGPCRAIASNGDVF